MRWEPSLALAATLGRCGALGASQGLVWAFRGANSPTPDMNVNSGGWCLRRRVPGGKGFKGRGELTKKADGPNFGTGGQRSLPRWRSLLLRIKLGWPDGLFVEVGSDRLNPSRLLH